MLQNRNLRRLIFLYLAIALFTSSLVAQAAPPANPNAPASAPAPSVNLPAALSDIDRMAQSAALDIARLRIDKWKTESAYKQQAQTNADSLSRNMTTALPTLTTAVRSAPQDLSALFK